MIYVTDAEFQRNFGRYRQAAAHQPVRVMSNDQPGVVVLTADQYHKLVAASIHIPTLRRRA